MENRINKVNKEGEQKNLTRSRSPIGNRNATSRNVTRKEEMTLVKDGNILQYLPKSFGKDGKRKGRGTGSGYGNMSTRGSKGQGRSSGQAGVKPGFEGGQMPWYKRIPKRGFTKYSKFETMAVRLNRLVEEMEKTNKKSASIQEILEMFDAPFYYKKIRVFGEVEKMPISIDIECNSISEGAKASISIHKGNVREKIPTTHSMRKKPLDY